VVVGEGKEKFYVSVISSPVVLSGSLQRFIVAKFMRNQNNPLEKLNVIKTMVEIINENEVGRFHLLFGIFCGLRRRGCLGLV
jgi:hypothetical protein